MILSFYLLLNRTNFAKRIQLFILNSYWDKQFKPISYIKLVKGFIIFAILSNSP
ncbi:MAG: hypothetical protein BAJALOKI2v1_350017 [Promethearchaeota archaeon]|nr:MAG: hypothetical protein BAJALOKI2v1_350017 [Candidatus Lokiarchaeota archaeon]